MRQVSSVWLQDVLYRNNTPRGIYTATQGNATTHEEGNNDEGRMATVNQYTDGTVLRQLHHRNTK